MRKALAVAMLITVALGPSVAQARVVGGGRRNLRRERERLRQERRRVESSQAFRSFWSAGQTWLSGLEQAVGQVTLDESPPAATPAGARAAQIEALVAKLGDRRLAMRARARRELVRIGTPAAGPLAKALTGDASSLRSSVKVTLLELGAAGFPQMLALLEHETSQVRRDALTILEKIFQPEHLGPIVGVFKKTALQDVKKGLTRVLAGGMRGQDMMRLVYLFNNEQDTALRNVVLRVMARYGDIAVLPALVKASNPDNRRDRAAVALANAARKGIAVVVNRLRDKRQVPRLYAIYRAAPPGINELMRPKLKSLAAEDPRDDRNYRFFFYVREKKVKPNGGGRWLRGT